MASDKQDLLSLLVYDLVCILRPLAETESKDDAENLLASFGLPAESELCEAIAAIAQRTGALRTFLAEQMSHESEPTLDAARLALAVSDACGSLSSLRHVTVPQAGQQILDALVIKHLRDAHPVVYYFLRTLGAIGSKKIGDGSAERVIPAVNVRTIISFLFSTGKWADDNYRWSTEFDSREFFSRMEDLLSALGIAAANYGGGSDDQELRVPVVRRGSLFESYAELGLSISSTPAGRRVRKGLSISLYSTVVGQPSLESLDIGNWNLKYAGSADLHYGLGTLFRPNQDSRFYLGSISEADGLPSYSLSVRLEKGSKKGGSLPLTVGIGHVLSASATNMYIELSAAGSIATPDLSVQVGAESLELAFKIAKFDGFTRHLLGGDIRCNFEASVGWHSAKGLEVNGSADWYAVIPLHISLGPLDLSHVCLRALASDSCIKVELTLSVCARLGPMVANVQDVGVQSFVALRGESVSEVEVGALEPRLPSGAGFAVDVTGVSGGGFLSHDELRHRYAGALQLSFGEIGLTAIGLITTKDPVSILIAICVEFSPSIQLSFGFALRGVGGLIGVNRTLAVDVLRERLRSGAAQSILFPKDLIVNADRIIGDLEAVFPSKKNRFVVGPMVKITWGPDVLQGDLGIFIELPQPVRVVVLGAITLALPRPDKVVIELHLDVLGVVDFGNKTLAIDATLYDSRILGYPLTGDSALRLSWGDNPQFGLSVGGFHPAFTPPANFPVLQRMTLNLSSSSDLQLYAKAYHALTSNSLQFGASLELRAKASGATVEGRLRFDTLIYFSPFSFDVFIGGTIAAKYKGKKLAGISIAVFLSGPRPWHVKGSATFEILWFDITVRIDKKWAEETPVTIEAVDPLVELQNALYRPDTWGGIMPGERKMQESLRPLGASEKELILVHPLGRLEIRQNVLPLGETITKLGNVPVHNHNAIRIARITIGGKEVQISGVEDYFARGQFENLTNDQKLSLPSFEPFDAGVVTVGDEIAVDEVGGGLISDTVSCEFEAYELNEDGSLTSRSGVASSQVQPPTPQPRYKVSETPPQGRFTIASITDLRVATFLTGAELGWRTRMTADRMLREHLKTHPNESGSLQVIERAA